MQKVYTPNDPRWTGGVRWTGGLLTWDPVTRPVKEGAATKTEERGGKTGLAGKEFQGGAVHPYILTSPDLFAVVPTKYSCRSPLFYP